MVFCPVSKELGRQLRTVIKADGKGLAIDFNELIHDPDHPRSGDRCAHLNAQCLPIALIDHIQCSEGPAVIERVTHKVERPRVVHRLDVVQGLGLPCNDSLLRASFHVELHLAVNPVDPLVVEGVTIHPDTVKTLPKPPSWPLAKHLINGINNLLIPLQPIDLGPIQHRPRQTRNPAGPGL